MEMRESERMHRQAIYIDSYDPWESKVCDFYKPLEDDTDWLECSKCRVKPRTWEFDNGRFAKCLCGTQYGKSQAEAIGCWTYAQKHDGNMVDYPRNGLRDNWNEYAKGTIDG